MSRRTPSLLAATIIGLLLAGAAQAQDKMPKLVKGVLKTVPATPEEAELFTGPRPLHDLASDAAAWKPNYEAENRTLAVIAKNMTFRRDVWQLEFSFKTMRLMQVNNGSGGKQLVWYLLYKVKNTGGGLRTVEAKDEFGNPKFEIETGSDTQRFMPVFVLRSHEADKTYADQILPGVRQMIHEREIRDPNVALHDSVSITRVPLEVSTETTDKGVWGVAMWPVIDRETDFFSVYVQGLSNAYRWEDMKNNERKLTYKSLQLNFWRPSDAIFERTSEFRFGLPYYPDAGKTESVREMYGVSEQSDWNWVYLP